LQFEDLYAIRKLNFSVSTAMHQLDPRDVLTLFPSLAYSA